ncbi:MAG: Arm DNA-binding domain-containing protein, partial [Gammaproteobacteria bacterium]|nr:Arm DNA-binding domain-containing protein [Gammaproteobacteria bacterium]
MLYIIGAGIMQELCRNGMKAKLTTRSVSASKPRSKYYKAWDTDLAGFFLRVLPSGVKTYCIYYRYKGAGREYTIGKHGKVTADQARKQAKIKLGEIAKGKDIQTE